MLCCLDKIVELWTKRNFRCDCGNSKFGEFYCKLLAGKDAENADNSYNHNFKGQYCTCGRLYPDPDAEDQVEMIQCCICEDWFHEEHLGLDSSDKVPRDEEGEPLYEDFICQACSVACPFLTLYPETIWAAVKQPESVNTRKGDVEIAPSANSESVSTGKAMLLGENSGAGSSTTCILQVDLVAAPPSLEKSKPMFLSKNWREALCRCEKCEQFYTEKRVGFLLDKEDTIAEYEKMGKQKREEKLQQQEGVELKLLDRLGHVEKIEIMSGIADMKNEIHAFLENFDTSKPVTTADVHQVFENLAKKRRRTEQQLGITEGKQEQEQEQEEKASGGLAKETGLGRSSSLRIKIVLTREELEWLMLQLEENKEKRLEDALAEIERGRRKVLGWRPSLESITESPEVFEMER
ncbi:hypothetical protein RJ639_007542 [Escallonia herrerae]|uniref:Zinc finger PHD-type domain-containing protein n=1 Tax=Escallonia herrerae TaxID=1293975 RepID=A0AA88W2S5_9ASTE|nr:hypothetical protein RJ639_007542 [Escallonia herrerae]